MAEPLPSFEEIMQSQTGNTVPQKEGELPSFEAITGQPEKEVVEQKKFNEPAWTPYLISKAKDGMATLMALPGLPVSFLNEVQYWLYDGLEKVGGPEAPDRKDHPAGFGSLQENFRQTLSTKVETGVEGMPFGIGLSPTSDINLETQDPAKRYAGTIAEFAGGSVIPGAAIVNKAPTVFTKLMAGVAETASVVVGGAGAEAAGDTMASIAGEGYRSTGEVIGTTVGSLTPYAVPRAVAEIYARINAYMSPAVQKEIGKMAASNKIKEELSNVDEAMDSLAESQKLRENIPGYSPSLGMATDDIGIKTLEQRYSESSAQSLKRQTENLKKSEEAIQSRFDQMFPESDYNITNAPKGQIALVRQDLKKDIAKIDTQIKRLEDSVVKGVGDAELIGKEMRHLREAKQDLARQQKDTLYEDFYRQAETDNVAVNPEIISKEAGKILKNEGSIYQANSPILSKIYNRFVTKEASGSAIVGSTGAPLSGGPQLIPDISMREYHSMYKQVNSELNALSKPVAMGIANANQSAMYNDLRLMKKFFKRNLDELSDSQYGATAEKFNKANDFYANEYQAVFKEGVGGRMAQYNKYGDMTADEDIVTNIVLKRASGIDDYWKIYGEGPESKTMLRNGIIDAFGRKAIKDSEFQESAAINFIEQHKLALNKVPEIKSLLTDKVAVYQTLVNRQKIITHDLKQTKKTRLSKLANGKDLDVVMKKAMGDAEDMSVLVNSVASRGGKEGLSSLRYGIADHVLKQPDPYNYFLQNQDKIKKGFAGSKEHFNTLRQLSEAKAILKRSFPVRRTETSLAPTDPASKFGTSFRELMTLSRHTFTGFLSPEYAVSHVASKGVFKLRQDEMNRLMEDAFYDPETAKLLMEGLSPQKLNLTTYIPRIKDKLFSLGVKANIELLDSDPVQEE